MASLEGVAARVLPPMIHGMAAPLNVADQAAIAAWANKTVLVNMLVSSREDRERGYGLPASEYHSLFELRDARKPLPSTQLWLGRADSRRGPMACVTPMVVRVEGFAEPSTPQAYVFTIVLGYLVIQGVRFTTPGLEIELTASKGFIPFWPERETTVTMPLEPATTDKTILRIEKGRGLRAALPNVSLVPWRTATDLPQSTSEGPLVRLPTPCGDHFVGYPAVLAQEALRGVYHVFMTYCECDRYYLVRTEDDGAHFKVEGSAEAIKARYDSISGKELYYEDTFGAFLFKRVSWSPE